MSATRLIRGTDGHFGRKTAVAAAAAAVAVSGVLVWRTGEQASGIEPRLVPLAPLVSR